MLLRKDRSSIEVYNDLDSEIVNLFRVLRVPEQSTALLCALDLTPYSREEQSASYESSADPVEQARRTIVRSMMGHGSSGASSPHRTGFRFAKRREYTAAMDWSNYPIHLQSAIARLRGVIVEHDRASTILDRYDAPDTLFYVDPPYVTSTRASSHAYKCDLTDADHVALASTLRGLTGAVILSGYRSPLYDDLFGDWERRERRTRGNARVSVMECLWLNPKAAAGSPQLAMEAAL